ncbi:MAG: hypothetical protein HYU84_11455 [Chloroflexi bacterium]|nr:hypothetical protein [Chloroflexota bacterium]MBI3168935.1 hypothetical protein [Chloroflexota bacterium]
MKNTKWIWRVLAVLLSLAVLAGVGFTGFRVGVVQGANLTADGAAISFHHGRGFDNDMSGDGFSMRGLDHGRNFSGHGNFGGRGGFGFFSPLFGLFHLAVFGGLIWLAYTFVKRSGWRVVNVNAQQTAPASAQAEAEEKKDEA